MMGKIGGICYAYQKVGTVHKLYLYDEVKAKGDFNWETYKYDDAETYKSSMWTNESGYTYVPNSNTIVFVNDRFTDKQTAIKLVQNTYVIYALTSQIETDLTPEEIQAYKNLVTYAGTTIVENNAECYMEVSAGGGDSLRAKKLALILGE